LWFDKVAIISLIIKLIVRWLNLGKVLLLKFQEIEKFIPTENLLILIIRMI